ncbi:MAG TPA: hypothetical protein VHP58_06645 [Alphaproteobacteria bacterium]|nr:hypothetical protein [Alphaproteobacteria bacterium]
MPRKKAAKVSKKTTAAKVPARQPFKAIIILDTGPQFTAAEAELRLRTMAAHHTKGAPLPPVVRVSALDASPLASAMALYRAWRAVGHGAPALYLCASTTGNEALTMLTTDWGNAVLAPNDGTLSLIARLFAERHITFQLFPLDLENIIQGERARMENPDWEPAPDFALRDYLAPAAALCVAGISPVIKHASPLMAQGLPFAEGSRTMSLKLHQPLPTYALPLGNGEFLLNLTLDPLSYDQLIDDRAVFSLEMDNVHAPCRFTRLMRLPTVEVEPDNTPTGPLPTALGTRRVGTLGLDGTLAPAWDERFLTLKLQNAPASSSFTPLPLTLIRQK